MFYDFSTFVNNLLYLWPIYALLLYFLFVIAKYIYEWIRIEVADFNFRKEQQLKEIIKANSEWYKKVMALNEQTKYYEEVLGNGLSVYCVEVNNKGKFDRTEPIEGLYEYLTISRSSVEQALERVYRNRVIDEVYFKKYRALRSTVSVEMCSHIGIGFEKFIEIEKKVVNEATLKIVKQYSISIYVRYASPQGRNRYSKHKVFHESDIRAALKEIDRQVAFQSSEEFRRKKERSKVTPSLRYDVMKRDGFCCRLCGRSADAGLVLEVDHIIPISRGGTTTYGNLQTLCRDCNRGKGTKK